MSTHPASAFATAVFSSAASPDNFLRGGAVNTETLHDISSYGYYSSPTANSAGGAYNLYFDNKDIIPSNGNARNLGFSLRCVSR